jgi:hypothetical protein
VDEQVLPRVSWSHKAEAFGGVEPFYDPFVASWGRRRGLVPHGAAARRYREEQAPGAELEGTAELSSSKRAAQAMLRDSADPHDM